MNSIMEFVDNDNDSDSNSYPLSKLAENEWKSFAVYTTEARAIPHISDGLKPVQRFYLYSSLVNTKTAFEKVSAVAGVISKYGYNHGEGSAAGAGQLMAASWNNNIQLIEGRGSFGSRLVQAAGAARYTYTKLHPNFFKYVKDVDISPAHPDPEHVPPAYYVPVIPLVLCNGIAGIATGFATHILPRDPEELRLACIEYVKSGKIPKRPSLKFPEFSGKTWFNETEKRYYWQGTFEKRGKTVLLITEVPYGYDRVKFIEILDKLEEDGKIVSYEEQCDKTGFKFEVKLKQNVSATWTDDEIVREFKLQKVATENLTVIGFDGKLKEYDDEMQIIRDFCDFRMGILEKRIKKKTLELDDENNWLKLKMKFIQAILDEVIVFKGKDKKTLVTEMEALFSTSVENCERLLKINIASLTLDMIKQLEKEIKELDLELEYWKSTTPQKQFIKDLNEIK